MSRSRTGVGTGVRGERRGRRSMGNMEMEAGPSDWMERLEKDAEKDGRRRSRMQRRTERSSRRASTSTSPQSSPKQPINPLQIAPFLLPFLPLTSAAPPASHPRPRHSPKPTQQPIPREPKKRDIAYLTEVASPTDVPSVIQIMDETALPYVLTKSSDGSWQKVDGGWRLYGRQGGSLAGVMADADGDGIVSTTADPSTSTFAVEEALPKGWGQTSNRTSFYKVPLIVVSSVILAIGIVIGIILMVFSRRKAHRRAKRKADRLRRKALAAAGLRENDVNGESQRAAFNEKLKELEETYGSSNKGNRKGMVKVGRWRSGGLRRRRRKGKGKDEDGGDLGGERGEGEVEVIAEEGVVRLSTDSAERGDEDQRNSNDSARSGSGSADAHERTVNTSEGSHTTPQLETSGTSGPTDSDTSTSERDQRQEQQGGGVPYFPPAYRPASVRSYVLHDRSQESGQAGSSSAPTATEEETGAREKLNAPGYYPAPATEDGERALAVASRSDGKARMVDVPVEHDGEGEEAGMRRVGHVATDDKRLLERMRLGGSAPPVIGERESLAEEEGGASAPRIEVDDDGFERIAEDLELPPSLQEEEQEDVSGGLPAPPRPARMRSLGVPSSIMDTGRDEKRRQLEEEEILPSAPPGMHEEIGFGDGLGVPSAPPLEDEGEAEGEGPSAPPLLPDEDDDQDGALPEGDGEGEEARRLGEARPRGTEGQGEGGQEGTVEAGSVGVKPTYLPRYEP